MPTETSSKPPLARREISHLTHHGHTIEDAYAWLKDPSYPNISDPEILSYLEQENAYFAACMAPLASQVDELFEEMKARQPVSDASVPYFKNGYWYQWRFAADAQYRVWCRLPGTAQQRPTNTDVETNPDWQVLVDEPRLAEGHDFFRLGGLAISPDGGAIAYSTDTDGSERFTLFIKDLATGVTLCDPITETTDAPIWDAQGTAVYYVRVSDSWRPFQVWRQPVDRQVPGDHASDRSKTRHDASSETSQNSSKEAEKLFEEQDASFFVHISLTQSERYLIISTGGHTTSEVHYLPRAGATNTLRLVSPRQEGHEYDVDHRNDEFIVRSNINHANFDLFHAPEADPQAENWSLLLAGDDSTYVLGHMCLKHAVVAEIRLNGLDQIRIIEGTSADAKATARVHDIGLPESAYVVGLGHNPSPENATLRLSYSSMVTPNTVFEYNIEQRKLTPLKVQQIPSGYDPELFHTERLLAPARDGASIPISLVYHQDTPIDGTAPLYLYGYGAYGHAIPPTFSGTHLSLLERGFIYAIAHIRGGDELGYGWYTAGKLDQRTNTFNDFVDCTHHLIDGNYACAGNIAIAGGSAGGELMGAVVNQAPELWGAVAAHVPFVDVLNTMLDESLPLTPLEWPEWGNPIEDANVFEFIRSYSPYDQLTQRDYPPMLVTAGLNDPRVTYWEPAKYVAKLRHLKTDNQPLLLKTNMGAGHGGKSGRFAALEEVAEEFAFIINALKSK